MKPQVGEKDHNETDRCKSSGMSFEKELHSINKLLEQSRNFPKILQEDYRNFPKFVRNKYRFGCSDSCIRSTL